MRKNNGLIKGAAVLSVGTVLTKILGALFRVPLTSIIGVEGIGLYQMVFPFYCVLLTISSTGIPSALSKLIAEGRNAEKVLYKSVIVFGTLGLAGSFAMFFLGEKLSVWQGNAGAAFAYKTLSPSVFVVSLISCLRGYFQGKMNMVPTACSQIIEQGVKLIIALSVLVATKFSPYINAGLCTLAVTASEIVALGYLLIKFKTSKKEQSDNETVSVMKILSIVIPVALSSALLPLSRAADSFLVIKLLPYDTETATSLYGVYSGAIESLIGVPVALCHGLAISGIPLIAKDKNGGNVFKLIVYTAVLSSAAWILTVLFAPAVTQILYSGLSAEIKETMVELLRYSGIQIVFLSLLQSLTGVLIAKDNAVVAPANLICGVIVKLALTFALVPDVRFGVKGMAISDISCFFVAAMLDLLYIITISKREKRQTAVVKTVGCKLKVKGGL